MFLFVEDSGIDVAKAASSLSRLGLRNSRVVDTADKAMEFLRRVGTGAQAPPEGVILDLLLRGSSGQDVLRYIRCRNQLKAIPILVWTVVEDEVTHRICRSMGAREVLVKSRRAEELREAVLRLRRDLRFSPGDPLKS